MIRSGKQKIERNDPCWCGSGRKYKTCHMNFDDKLRKYQLYGAIVPDRSLIKNRTAIDGIKKSAEINMACLDAVAKEIGAGMPTEDIDKIVYDTTVRMGGIPAPLHYEGFPKSVCTSINEEVCHGIPDEKHILKDGDIVTAVNGTLVRRPLEFGKQLWHLDAKSKVEFTLSNGRKIIVRLRDMSNEERIAYRLGIRVQKLTRKLNIALELPEETKGLAISEVMKPEDYKDEDDGWRKYIKRGDLLLKVNRVVMEDEKQLANLLEKKTSGNIVNMDFAVMNNNGRYQLRRETVLLK